LGYNKASGATAHKLQRTLYAVLHNDKPYHDPKVDRERFFVKRNAPRWVHVMKKHGVLPKQH